MKLWVPVVKFSVRQIEFGNNNAPGRVSTRWTGRLNRKRNYILPGVILGAALLIFMIWHSINGPNYGQVAIIGPDTTTASKLPEYTTLTTNYYSLNYSQRYHQVPTDIAPAGLLDQKVLAFQLGGQTGQSEIEVDIKAAPYGGITLDNTYDFYAKHPMQYKMSNKFYRGEAVDIARSIKGQPETTAMWLHNGFIMVAKITTADAKQNINTELMDLLSSVQWRD